MMDLLEVYETLFDLRNGDKLSKKERIAVDRAMQEVNITIENGDGFDV